MVGGFGVAVEAALDDGVFQRHFPRRDEVEVLVLTSSRRRLQALRQVAARLVHSGRRDLWYFATFEALEPTAFASAEWVDLDGRSVSGVRGRGLVRPQARPVCAGE